jgi:hypothetical protein
MVTLDEPEPGGQGATATGVVRGGVALWVTTWPGATVDDEVTGRLS